MFFFTNMIDFPFFAQYFYYFVISAKIEICFPFYRVIISIHAPHVGARPFMSFSSCYSVNISIHAPRVGARQQKSTKYCVNFCGNRQFLYAFKSRCRLLEHHPF